MRRPKMGVKYLYELRKRRLPFCFGFRKTEVQETSDNRLGEWRHERVRLTPRRKKERVSVHGVLTGHRGETRP